MVTLPVAIVPLTVMDKTVNVSPGGDPGIGLPGIRTDDGTRFYPLRDQGKECVFIHLIDDLSPDLAVPAENPEDGLLRGPPASPGSPIPHNLPLVPPCTSEVGFIDLYGARKNLWNLPRKDHPDPCERPEYSLFFESGLLDNGIRALFHQE